MSITGSDNLCSLNVWIIDGIDVRIFVIISMSMSQPSTSIATSRGDHATINDVSMANP
jgi:hypothetical protein